MPFVLTSWAASSQAISRRDTLRRIGRGRAQRDWDHRESFKYKIHMNGGVSEGPQTHQDTGAYEESELYLKKGCRLARMRKPR
jgi:hypothetical protein